jgi:transposase
LADHRTGRGKRRSYSKAFKRRVVAETLKPGVSVASVARHYGLNANMVFLWRRDPRFGPGRDAASFLPVEVTSTEVTVAPEPISPASDSRIEIALASGHRLTLSGGFDPDMVARIADHKITRLDELMPWRYAQN